MLGAVDVFRGVPGGAKHFEALDDFERVPAGVASPGPSNSLKMSALASSRVWNSCVRSFSPSGFSKCVKEKNESVSMMPMSVAHGRWYHAPLLARPGRDLLCHRVVPLVVLLVIQVVGDVLH